jgi:hypothetical protein
MIIPNFIFLRKKNSSIQKKKTIIALTMMNRLLIVLVENLDYFQMRSVHSMIEVFHVMELYYIYQDFRLKIYLFNKK